MKRNFLFMGLALGMALAGCGNASTSAQSPTSTNAGNAGNAGAQAPGSEYVAQDAKGIQTMTVRKTAIPDYLDLAAHIEPDPTRVVHVFAPAGGRIVELRVRPWDRVEKGQTIAELESSDLARAVADYHKALVDNQVKQKQLAREQDLLEHKAISEREFQQAQGDAEQAAAEVEAAREQIQVFGMDPDHASTQLLVKAPRSGVILDVGAAPGEFSQALSASAPLSTVADITTVWAVGDIYEKDLQATKTGEPAQVTLNAYPGEKWTGRVSVVSSAVDPVTRTLHLRVVLPNADLRIKPAMFGSIRLVRSTAQGIEVPATAVVREGNDSYVFVAEGNGRYRRRDVKLGRSVDGSLEILSGLNEGDTVVSEGALFLRSAAAAS
ncbi:MAG TPA: efflux RND transporter periplasmic adaptor subunit [Candidatus Acidoferrales bacterium]|nr:efflux RND transporter periplasmic adaptor subunit [Candidatus Acidoferrales bacterium]